MFGDQTRWCWREWPNDNIFDQTQCQTPHAKNYGRQITRVVYSTRDFNVVERVQIKEEYSGYNPSWNIRGGWKKEKVEEERPGAGWGEEKRKDTSIISYRNWWSKILQGTAKWCEWLMTIFSRYCGLLNLTLNLCFAFVYDSASLW